MNILLLLTHSYPYGAGEDFLSAELEQVSGFDRVLVCPCSRESGAVQTKKVPEGVSCVPLQRHKLGSSAYPRLLFQPCVAGELFRLLFSGKTQAARMHELLYFMRNAEEIFFALRQAVSVKPGDSVTIYSYWLYDAAVAGVRFAEYLRKQGVRVRQISRAHGFDIHAERAKYGYLPMRHYLFEHVERIFPCSEDGASVLRREAAGCPVQIRTAYLGTRDCGMGLPEAEPLHLVSCSYMVPVKRLDLIAEALWQADFPVRWTHFGSGPLEAEIRRQSEQLPPNVTAEFAGQMENNAVLDYYRRTPISVFVNVSSSEGIPVTVMEACSFGIPVIATDVGGTHEIVADGKNGFLLPKDFTPDQFLEALRKIRAMSADRYRLFSAESRRIWQEKFNAAENYRKFYSSLISDGSET